MCIQKFCKSIFECLGMYLSILLKFYKFAFYLQNETDCFSKKKATFGKLELGLSDAWITTLYCSTFSCILLKFVLLLWFVVPCQTVNSMEYIVPLQHVVYDPVEKVIELIYLSFMIRLNRWCYWVIWLLKGGLCYFFVHLDYFEFWNFSLWIVFIVAESLAKPRSSKLQN